MTKVLVVDDSAFMRNAISRILAKDNTIEVVGTARNGQEALEKVEALKPDVVTLDIEMPVMNGIEALKQIVSRHKLPVIMFSALSQEGAEVTMEALSLGASDFITKDFSSVSLNVPTTENELINKVKGVAKKRVAFLHRPDPVQKTALMSADRKARHKIVAIGASTGGPPAGMTVPSRPMRNLLKFQLMGPAKRGSVCLSVRYRYSGWMPAPVTLILENMGKLTP